MAKIRSGVTIGGRGYPRANWWKQAMGLDYYRQGGAAATEDTTADGRQLIISMGDSKTSTSPAAGPTPTAGTVKQWASSAISDVGATDLADVVSVGSPLPRMGINYNAASGKIPVFSLSGTGGARFSIHPTDLSWRSDGDLYAPMKAKADAALAALGLTKPKAIFITCGINDASGSEVLATIQTDIQSLLDRLTTDFSGCDIVMSIPGRNTAARNTLRMVAVRTYILDECLARTNVYPLMFESCYDENALNSDNLHWGTSGNDWAGIFFAQWMANSAYSKFARGFISSMFTNLSTPHKVLLDTCIAAEVANGNFAKYEFMYWFKNGDIKDMWIDATGHYTGNNTSLTQVADSHIAAADGTRRLNPGWIAGSIFSKTGQDSVFVGAKLRTRISAANAVATLFGASDAGTDTIIVAQTATPSIVFAANDQTLTASTSPDASLTADTFYGVLRFDANDKHLVKNAAIVQTAAVASTGEPTAANLDVYLSVKNEANVIVNALAGTYEYFVAASGDIDYAAFFNNWDNVATNW